MSCDHMELAILHIEIEWAIPWMGPLPGYKSCLLRDTLGLVRLLEKMRSMEG